MANEKNEGKITSNLKNSKMEHSISKSQEDILQSNLNVQNSLSEPELELHLYYTGTAAIFYKAKMSEEQFKIAMQINSLLQRAYKKGMRFKFTMDIQLQLNLPL